MAKFGTKVFQEFNFHHWIEIRKGKIFYKAYIMDEKKNTIAYTRFFQDFDECLEAARTYLDDIMEGRERTFENPMA